MALGAPDASGRRRPGARGRHRVHHRLRPRPAGHRPGSRPGLAGARRGGRARQLARAPRADAVTFATGRRGRLRHRRRAHRRGHRRGRPSPRAAAPPTPSTPTCRARTSTAIRTRQTLAEPQPEFLSIVPYTGEVKEPRLRLRAMPAEERSTLLRRVRDPLHAGGGDGASRRAACSAPARPSATATCAARASSTAPRCARWSPRAPACRCAASPRTASRASTTTTSATTATPSSCASPPAASTAAAAPTCARRSWARPATTSCARASTRS